MKCIIQSVVYRSINGVKLGVYSDDEVLNGPTNLHMCFPWGSYDVGVGFEIGFAAHLTGRAVMTFQTELFLSTKSPKSSTLWLNIRKSIPINISWIEIAWGNLIFSSNQMTAEFVYGDEIPAQWHLINGSKP